MENKKICIAEITSPHGIQGEVKIRTFLENPKDLKKFKNISDKSGNRVFAIEGIRGEKKDTVIARVDGITDRNEAEKLRRTELYIDKKDLPKTKKGEFYYHDVIGLKVFENKKEIGIVKNVYNFGAGTVLEVKLNNPKGEKEIDVPFIDEYVKDIDLEKGIVSISMPEYI
jgi:16S rRNA processing protein RimM